MMQVWRIAVDAPTFAADDLSGAGAKLTGGRWNRVGSPVVYASASIALACLETMVHLGPAGIPLRRHLIRIDIPDEIWSRRRAVAPTDARTGWEALPAGEASRAFGEAWLAACETALLAVPSIVVPEECNVLVNPLHPDAKRLVPVRVRPWRYDTRLSHAA
ncbi:MAG: RES domain-containing protein [Rhodocyclaceae bacterium]|nr:RES domain-containing protein [Rhodocyclaceae bacterium]